MLIKIVFNTGASDEIQMQPCFAVYTIMIMELCGDRHVCFKIGCSLKMTTLTIFSSDVVVPPLVIIFRQTGACTDGTLACQKLRGM